MYFEGENSTLHLRWQFKLRQFSQCGSCIHILTYRSANVCSVTKTHQVYFINRHIVCTSNFVAFKITRIIFNAPHRGTILHNSNHYKYKFVKSVNLLILIPVFLVQHKCGCELFKHTTLQGLPRRDKNWLYIKSELILSSITTITKQITDTIIIIEGNEALKVNYIKWHNSRSVKVVIDYPVMKIAYNSHKRQ